MPRYHSTTALILEAILSSSLRASNMTNKASNFLKQVLSVIVTMVKAKTMALKSKTSAIKTRLIIFGLLRNKKVLLSAINHKIHALMGHEKGGGGEGGNAADEEYNKAIVLYNAATNEATPNPVVATEYGEQDEEQEEGDDDEYLTHSLFDLGAGHDELDNGTGSVIDLVKNSREDSENFVLEDEIDHVADVFIKRFHRQMRIQKQESFKRYQEMLQRSA